MQPRVRRTHERGYRRRERIKTSRRQNQKWFAWKLRWVLLLFLIVPVLLHVKSLDKTVRTQFEGKRWALPARVYARPLELYPGMNIKPEDLGAELRDLNYRLVSRLQEPGDYRRKGNDFYIKTRDFSFWDGQQPSRSLRLRFKRNQGLVQIADLDNRRKTALLRLDPQLIGKIYPTHNEDRILVRLADIPPIMIQALIAVEDRAFYQHHGVSLRGTARAMVANFRAGELVQGGSTITQQLIKNYFLTPERTIWRKLNEATMALLLEWNYEKDQILEAYLNEVYVGQDGNHAIHGMGMGSWFYFNRPLSQLKLPEVAMLVGMIRAASIYNPRKHPERAWKRRALVLSLMENQGLITAEQAEAARQAPLNVTPRRPRSVSPYPTFLDLVRRQLRRDYREEDLRSEGLQVFTTLDPLIQRQAEQSLIRQVKSLEKENRLRKLEGSLIVTGSETGEVIALVGGRNPRFDGFNRALDAIRPVGSIIKPAVYLAALERSREYSLLSTLRDDPVKWTDKHTGEEWVPRNYDGKLHGDVPLHKALAYSYNLATVNLGFELGLDYIRDVLYRLGIEREFPVYPSMLLGGVNLSPFEVTQMYQTIASDGFRIPIRAIRNVLDHEGKPLNRYALEVKQNFDPAPVFLLDYALQKAVREGTGRKVAAEKLDQKLVVAGKTGTTNNFRDSWFAGYSDDLLAVAWLGRDDNRTINLSGGEGAMRVWGDFMAAMQPRSLGTMLPKQVQWRWVRDHRNQRVKMPFIVGSGNPRVEATRPAVWQP